MSVIRSCSRMKGSLLFVCCAVFLLQLRSIPYRQNWVRLNQSAVLPDSVHSRIIGPKEFGSGCHASCGCPQTKRDCPRHYHASDVNYSADLSTESDVAFWRRMLRERHSQARQFCRKIVRDAHSDSVLETGGWCLRPGHALLKISSGMIISLPVHHVHASKRVVHAMSQLIVQENISSLNDFGAGVGQYGVELLQKFPQLQYRAYDGAGNIVNYTGGFVNFFDLTIPLHLPIAEWVFCLEVGEHVPSRYEGVLIRNIHKHNCRGVVLSWGILGQGGHQHVNNHHNSYIVAVFNELGYYRDVEFERLFRMPESNYGWFTQSVMVFRRWSSAC
eukprot:762655-Hanusia_phi.AAC.1